MTRLIAVTGATAALGGRVAARAWETRRPSGHPALTVAEHLRSHPERRAHLAR